MTIDTTRAPRGELVAAELVAAIAAHGVLADLTERHYLELKGPESLDSKSDKHKIAKFILGAANRSPQRSQEAFEGYGVMVIGITANGVTGVQPIEMLELQKVVKPFLGEAGPRWDVVRVPADDSTRQVLIVLVDPPQDGQPAFICRASGEKLQSGHVYFRDDGETRQAYADEMDMLAARGASGGSAPIELEVGINGTVVPLVVDEARTLDEYIEKKRARLLEALPKPNPEADPVANSPRTAYAIAVDAIGISAALSGVSRIGAADFLGSTEPEKRTEAEYIAEIDAWESSMREAWPGAVEAFAGYVLPSSEVLVSNRAETFLHDVEVTLHLEGPVESIESSYCDDDGPEWRDLRLPPPPRRWGPTKRNLSIGMDYSRLQAMTAAQSFSARPYIPSSTNWKNSGSVTVGVSVGDLRPRATFESDDEESVLVIRGEVPADVRGTWDATARGYNQVFKGDSKVEVADPTILTDLMRKFLGLE